MVKKRSVFDINFDPSADAQDTGFPAGNQRAPETKAFNVQGHPLQDREPARRGPMASAIVETAEANVQREGAEAAIRAENDSLAHEFVRLKKLGLITDLIQTSQVLTSKLIRDRSANLDPDLSELKDSIQAVGLSNPIRVEQSPDGYELIQGFRRLQAFRELADETGDPRYTRIPAALVPRGEPLEDLYRKMVDENLVRKDLSFGEMAQLALSYATDTGVDTDAAVTVLYASALKQKRSYIRQFARLLQALDGALRHPETIPRALGLEVAKVFESDPDTATRVADRLRSIPDRDGATELRVLRDGMTAAKAAPARAAKTVSKTSLRLVRPEGEARIIASQGRIDLRLDKDFSAVSKARLQSAIEAFLNTIENAD